MAEAAFFSPQGMSGGAGSSERPEERRRLPSAGKSLPVRVRPGLAPRRTPRGGTSGWRAAPGAPR